MFYSKCTMVGVIIDALELNDMPLKFRIGASRVSEAQFCTDIHEYSGTPI